MWLDQWSGESVICSPEIGDTSLEVTKVIDACLTQQIRWMTGDGFWHRRARTVECEEHTYLEYRKLMHLLSGTGRDHGLKSGKLLVHLAPPAPFNHAVCGLPCNFLPRSGGRSRLLLGRRFLSGRRLGSLIGALCSGLADGFRPLLRFGLQIHLDDPSRPSGWRGK